MNALVKLFIVLIFVASIMFMSFAVVLYATHTNWKAKSEEAKAELKTRTDELAKLRNEKANMETALNIEKDAAKDRNTAINEKLKQIDAENKKLVTDIAELKVEIGKDREAMIAAARTTELLRIRYDETSKQLLTAQTDWAAMMAELTEKIDETHTLALQVTQYQSVSSQLAQDYKDAIEVLRKHNLQADPVLYAEKPPAGIHGLVTEVRPKGMLELSVGTDAGLSKGHQLDVVRNLSGRTSYIGKIEIIETAPDRSVARILPEFRRGTVQKGDNVQYIEINELTAK